MSVQLVLASASTIRAKLLRQAGIPHDVMPAQIDESAVKQEHLRVGRTGAEIALILAKLKAEQINSRVPDQLVLGCDQILEHEGMLLSKPLAPDDALKQLTALRGQTHQLISTAVLYHQGAPLWHATGTVKMTMRSLSDAYLQDYVARQWPSIRHAVGCYKLEEEGVRLFSAVEGDYFHVLGMPLLELITYLSARGELET